MTTTAYRFTAAGRQALKTAISAAPGWPTYRAEHGISGTGTLTIDGLLTAAAALGIDPAPFAMMPATAPAAPVAAAAPATDPEGQDGEDPEGEDPEGQEAAPPAPAIDPVAAAVLDVLAGDLTSLPDRIKALAARAVTAEGEAARLAALPVAVSSPAGSVAPVGRPLALRQDTAGRVFGLRGAAGRLAVTVGDSPLAPPVDAAYQWPDILPDVLALAADGRGTRVWLFGDAGTGKTTFAAQLAARLGRPFFRVNFDRSTEAPDVVGMTVPDASTGGVRWQDGQLALAMRSPAAVVLLDEPATAPPGVLAILHGALETGGALSIRETGEVIPASPLTLWIAADNSAGHGDTTGRYNGLQAMNGALLDRFELRARLDYLPPAKEAAMVSARSGCPLPLAAALVELAGYSRQAADRGELTAPIGPRRLIALARLLTAGRNALAAWAATIGDGAAPEDSETLAQLRQAHYNPSTVEALARGHAAPAVPPPATSAGASAQAEFEPVQI